MKITLDLEVPIVILLTGICLSQSATPPPQDNADNSNTVYSPAPSTQCDYDFTGPADDVFIIDRSESVNQDNFHRSKEFVKFLIQNSFVIKEDMNRIAIITYTNTVTMTINSISGSQAGISQCELFLQKGVWHNVLYNTTEMHGANLDDALLKAKDIFDGADPPNVRKRLWIMTDFHDTTIPNFRAQNYPGVDFYGVGVGTFNTEIEHPKFYDIITEDPYCRYRKIMDWEAEDTQSEFVRSADKSGGELGEYVSVSDLSVCTAYNCTTGCTCQEFNPLNTLRCTGGTGSGEEDDGDSFIDSLSENNLLLIIIIFSAIFGVILIVICVLVLCCCYRCRKKRAEKPTHTANQLPTLTRSEATTTDTMSTNVTDASTYTNGSYLHPVSSLSTNASTHSNHSYLQPISEQPTLQVRGGPNNGGSLQQGNSVEEEDLYMNGDLADILKAHGVVVDSTMQRNKPAEVKTDSSKHNKGKYKKNPKLPEIILNSQHPYAGENNRFNKRANDMEGNYNKSIVSQISETPSSHSYIEPIADNPNQRGPYSYAYMDSNMRTVSNNQNPKTPPSSHSYQDIDFTPPPKKPVQVESMDLELTSKLQRMRKRISAALTGGGNNPSSNNSKDNSVPNMEAGLSKAAGQRFPHNMPANISSSQEQEESNPTYIDPNSKFTNSKTSKNKETQESVPIYIDPIKKFTNSTPLKTKETITSNHSNDASKASNRKSAKLGQLKFKNLMYKFSSSDKGEDEHVTVSHVNQGYEPGPDGPYSVVNDTHDGSGGEGMPQAFREIM